MLREQLHRTSELVVAQRLPEAELELLRAQADAPHDLRVLKLLALVRFKLGRLAEARQIYREAAQIAPEDAAIRLNLGLIALKLDWFDEAVTELETTVRLRPEDRRAWSYLGYACARTGARAQAAAAFRRAGQHELAAEMERVATTSASVSEEAGVAAVETEHARAVDVGPATPRPELRTQVLDTVMPAPPQPGTWVGRDCIAVCLCPGAHVGTGARAGSAGLDRAWGCSLRCRQRDLRARVRPVGGTRRGRAGSRPSANARTPLG